MGQYDQKLAYLAEQARIGALTNDNRILQEMLGKKNLPEVREALAAIGR
ncbi:MAG: hypothetical protein ABIR91_05585 [Candidatus Saccharimonadales bacterium]